MPVRLGIDVGTNSIGWILIDRENERILDGGVRIFHDSRDPQSGTSLAADRRVARGARRNRDRRLKRRSRLMNALVECGLMPKTPGERQALEKRDPYELRARGLKEALSAHEFGRAIFHLGQRRGFKSNRKTDGSDKEASEYKARMSELDRRIEESGAATLGEFLHRRRLKKKPVRGRPGVGIAPTREMLKTEFAELWDAQQPHHPHLDDGARAAIHSAIFHQRDLHKKTPGRCELESGEDRAPRSLPIAHRFRIYQELNNLRYIDHDHREVRPDPEQRDALYAKLSRQKSMSFGTVRKMLGLDPETPLNLDDGKRTKLIGNETSATLSGKDYFGKAWWDKTEEEQDEIVTFLLDEEDENAVATKAARDWGLDGEVGCRLAVLRFKPGYVRLSRRAMGKLVEVMRDRYLRYDEAAIKIYGDHRAATGNGSADELPYYGEALSNRTSGGSGNSSDSDEVRFGFLPNPTIHVALNQLRRVVNGLIRVHGKPDEVVVELARDLKQGWEDRQKTQQKQAENQRRNERIVGELEKFDKSEIGDNTGENIRRWKLWEELGEVHDRCCPYTGDPISCRMLFSSEVQIEHILPFSRTLDDSMANRTLALRRANQYKGNRTPAEAFGESRDGYDYGAILDRASKLPRNKRWRFGPDAMERFEKDEGFIARQLTDTAYATRLARQYLTEICPPNQVWSVPGRLTALLRGKWGLNTILSNTGIKTRVDHRHHLIDAAVAAVTDRSLLQRMARASENERDRIIVPEPWDNFRDELAEMARRIVISHKPDHGTGGKLHEETAYGLIDDPNTEDGHNLVYRKSFAELNENEVKRIRDATLRAAVLNHLNEAEVSGITHKKAMADFPAREADRKCWPRGVDRVRLLKKEKDVIPIADPSSETYKAYSPGDNHHVDIWERPDGVWEGVGVTMFEANQDPRAVDKKKPHPAARRVMRVHNGDLIKLEHEGDVQIFRVVQLNPSAKRFRLAGHHDAGNLQRRHDDPGDPFRWTFASFSKLRERKARLVKVDALGRVRDPGPPGPLTDSASRS